VVDQNDLPTSRPNPVVVAVTTAARGGLLWVLVAGLLALRPGWRGAAAGGLVAAAKGMVAAHLVAVIVRRRRPRTANLPARRALPAHPDSPSFPSKHATVAAAFVTGVARHAPEAGALVAPLAVVVTYGRVRTRVHWPTDVLGGIAIGVCVSAPVTRGKRGPRWREVARGGA